jgi:hypothetical protein
LNPKENHFNGVWKALDGIRITAVTALRQSDASILFVGRRG